MGLTSKLLDFGSTPPRNSSKWRAIIKPQMIPGKSWLTARCIAGHIIWAMSGSQNLLRGVTPSGSQKSTSIVIYIYLVYITWWVQTHTEMDNIIYIICISLHIPGAGRTPCFVDTNLCPHPPSLQNVFFPAFYVYQSHVSRVFSKNSSPLDFPRFPRKSLQNTFGFGALIEIPKICLFCRDPLL